MFVEFAELECKYIFTRHYCSPPKGAVKSDGLKLPRLPESRCQQISATHFSDLSRRLLER